MKYYIFIFLLILVASSSNYIRGVAKATNEISVLLIGCDGKPYPNQTVQLQTIPCPTANGKCNWNTIKSYKTDNSGYVHINIDGEPEINIDKDLYRFYWEKSKWVNSSVDITTDQQNYVFGYAGVYGNEGDNTAEKAVDINTRIEDVAEDELNKSVDHYKKIEIDAKQYNREELIEKIKYYCTMKSPWDDRNKKYIVSHLNTMPTEKLRQWYVKINSEIYNSQRYRGVNRGYKWWCTAFTTFILSRSGGPIANVSANAAAFYDWFQKKENVRGQDGEIYSRKFISDQDLMSIFNKSTTTPKTSPIKTGNFFLEKRTGAKSSGHSAIAYLVDEFPYVYFISGNADYFVTIWPHEYNGKVDSYFDEETHRIAHEYDAAGQLECVQ